jgi:hypothetical protein
VPWEIGKSQWKLYWDNAARSAYAVRIFAKSPAFTLMAVLTMAIGVGANTAVFSLVNAVLLRSLPVSSPEKLAYIWTPNDRLKAPVPRELSPAGDDFEQLRKLNRSFSNMIAFAQSRLRIAANNEAPEYAGGAHVTGDFFQVLGGTRNWAASSSPPITTMLQ